MIPSVTSQTQKKPLDRNPSVRPSLRVSVSIPGVALGHLAEVERLQDRQTDAERGLQSISEAVVRLVS